MRFYQLLLITQPFPLFYFERVFDEVYQQSPFWEVLISESTKEYGTFGDCLFDSTILFSVMSSAKRYTMWPNGER